MKKTLKNSNESSLRRLPSVDTLLKTVAAQEISAEVGRHKLTESARLVIERLREDLRANENESFSQSDLLQQAEEGLRQDFAKEKRKEFQRVINATGVIVHTNLGRAPLAENAKKAILEVATEYCTLEYDLEIGARGQRGRATEKLLCELTGAQDAIIVNNCAAAAFLILSALAAGGESVVSRGELVEIGGDFRVPEVMAQSGTKLIEVGTTNRTKLKDFANAITESTRLLVRVHPSNFRIIGFTEMPSLSDLADLAHQHNVLLYEDAGSGALLDLSEYGLADEPIIARSIAAGADVVSFSGDKLLGGVQAGLIVGTREAIGKLRQHPLYRALRVDKIAYAALGATLEIYQRQKPFEDIPVLRMLTQKREEIEKRALNLVEEFKNLFSKFGINQPNAKPQVLNIELIEGTSAVGGGSAPLAKLPTVLIALEHNSLSASKLEELLRFSTPPIIGRVSENKFLLDLRTILESETNQVLLALTKIVEEI